MATIRKLEISDDMNSTPKYIRDETRQINSVLAISTDKIGVGTESPLEKLDLLGGDLFVRSPYPGSGNTPVSRKIFFETQNSFSSRVAGTGLQVNFVRNADTDFRSNLAFYTSLDNTPVERMRITEDGSLGVGTASPGAKLEVAGSMQISDGSGNKSILVVPPRTGNDATDKRNIQDAINAAATAGGGTVIVPTGAYYIQTVGGTATGGSGTTLEDYNTGVNFVSREIKIGDMVINLTKHCAGKITNIATNIITVGSLTGNASTNTFAANDKYCIPGLMMKDGVSLIGQGFGSVLRAVPTTSAGAATATIPIVFISADPTQSWLTYKVQNFKVIRGNSWDLSADTDELDVGIDVYNHNLDTSNPANSMPATHVIIDRIRMDGTDSFTTGIKMAGWSGSASNCEIWHCKIGIDLYFPGCETNSINLLYNSVMAGGTGYTGIRIDGWNNRVIGGELNSGAYHDVHIIDFNSSNKSGNVIIGSYIEGSGDDVMGINLGTNNGNSINGCYFDLSGSGAKEISEDTDIPVSNSIFGNYSSNHGSPKSLDWNAPAKLRIASYGQSILELMDQSGVAGADIGFNSSDDTVFIANLKHGTAGKNIALIVLGTSGNEIAAMTVLGGADADAGRIGVGTGSPSQKLEVNGNIKTSGAFIAGVKSVSPTDATPDVSDATIITRNGTSSSTNITNFDGGVEGQVITVVNIGTLDVGIVDNSNIKLGGDGGTLNTNETATFVKVGSVWYQIGTTGE